MSRTQDEIRRRLRAEYGELYSRVAALLLRHDPIGINFDGGVPEDEYEPEVGTILPRLKSCSSIDDVLRVVHEEFVHWFGADTAGGPDRYREIATNLWALSQNRSVSP